MIKRFYFMNAKCTSSTGYCYSSTIGCYSSFFPSAGKVFSESSDKLKKELLDIRPDGQFEVISFNKV